MVEVQFRLEDVSGEVFAQDWLVKMAAEVDHHVEAREMLDQYI